MRRPLTLPRIAGLLSWTRRTKDAEGKISRDDEVIGANREDRIMRHAKAVAMLCAMLSASAVAGNEAPNVSDEQMACAGAASQEYERANAALAQRATADGIVSVDDAIAQRRLAEDFCKRWATCLVSNITDAGLRENAPRTSFAGCLSGEAKDTE
jgi:hypothetical protein